MRGHEKAPAGAPDSAGRVREAGCEDRPGSERGGLVAGQYEGKKGAAEECELNLGKPPKGFDCLFYPKRKPIEGFSERFKSTGPWAKQYIEGNEAGINLLADFDILVEGQRFHYRAIFERIDGQPPLALVPNRVGPRNGDALKLGYSGDGDQQPMFVSVVEATDGKKVRAFWTRVWLQGVQDIDRLTAGPAYVSLFNLRLKARRLISDGELDVLRGMANATGEMIERAPEIVQRVSGDEREALRQLLANTQDDVDLLGFRVRLVEQGVRVTPKKFANLSIEVVDVMLGPT